MAAYVRRAVLEVNYQSTMLGIMFRHAP